MTASPIGPGPALFRLVRFWARRSPTLAATDLTGDARRVQSIQLVEAISTHADGTGGSEATVADVAHQLGVDRSVASRMASDALRAGLIDRGSSPADARRARLTLTDSGADLLARAREWQQRAYDGALSHWDPIDRERFGRYLERLATEITADRDHPPT